MNYLNKLLTYALTKLINLYQYWLSFDSGLLRVLSPQGACKYQPTCSEYTKQQIVQKGPLVGLFLGLKRFLTCI